MITLESSPPYDRIKLSKALGSTAEELTLRPKTFYSNSDIEVLTLTEAVSKNLVRLCCHMFQNIKWVLNS